MNRLAMLGVGVLLLFGVWQAYGNTVSSEEARRLVKDEGALLLDVRTTAEFKAGHLPRAVHIPVHRLRERMGELLPESDQEPKKRPIVVYCRSGNRSALARRVLKDAGFTQVVDLGGMYRW